MVPAWWPALAGVVLFVILGLLLIPYPGLQEDETIFAGPIYHPEASFSQISIGEKHLPLMLLTYLGALKSWLYAPIFRLWQPSLYSVRVPLAAALRVHHLDSLHGVARRS